MKKILLLLIIVLISIAIPAYAANWIFISEGNTGKNYLNTESVKYEGNQVYAWVKKDTRGTYVTDYWDTEMMNIYYSIDCKNKTSTVLQISEYGPRGIPIKTTNYPVKFQYIQPDSVPDILYNNLCR